MRECRFAARCRTGGGLTRRRAVDYCRIAAAL